MPEKLKIKRHKTRVNDPSALGVDVLHSKNICGLLSHKIAKTQGFTLIEMLLTLAIVAILVSMAIPRYEQFVAQQDVNRVTQQMRDHLQLARTHAQTHQTTVQLCPVRVSDLNDHRPECVNDDTWAAWVVVESNTQAGNGSVIARSEALTSSVTVSKTNQVPKFSGRGALANFAANGTITVSSVSFPTISEQITIAPNGRVR